MPSGKIAPAILVVGADGLIGGSLLEYLSRAGRRVLGTTRRRETADDTRLYLDLAEGADEWQLPCDVSAVIICVGISKIDVCEREPEATARVNVEGVYALARNLICRGTFVVYLSTNQVFDGTAPNRLPDDERSARTQYGVQRAEVERRLLALNKSCAVVRLTKVVQPEMPLLKSWLDALRRGETIRPFADMSMSPIPLSFVLAVIEKVIDRRASGIMQVSGAVDVTYAQVAYHLADRVGVSSELVAPRSVKEAGIPADAAPAFTTLDTARLLSEFELEPPDVWATIDSALGL